MVRRSLVVALSVLFLVGGLVGSRFGVAAQDATRPANRSKSGSSMSARLATSAGPTRTIRGGSRSKKRSQTSRPATRRTSPRTRPTLSG